MSETVSITGKMKKIDLEEVCKMICKENNYSIDGCDSYQEALSDSGGREYFIKDNEVYKVFDIEENEGGDIFKASESNGEIDFVLQYYNGGCSFEEALDEALSTI